MTRLRDAWAQFLEIGIPRCSESLDDGCGRRLIWPWQAWVCDVEEWPVHHACHHRNLRHMYDWMMAEERRERWKHSDMYDRCRFCERPTTELAVA